MAAPVEKKLPHPPLGSPPPTQRRESRKQEMTTVRLFNAMVERIKLERGYHHLSDKEVEEKLAELKKKIDSMTGKLSNDDIVFVQNQITALSNTDLQEQE